MVAELLERLDLHDVTLVQNDHAAALVLAGENPPRVARLVISSCEAFENYPPGPARQERAHDGVRPRRRLRDDAGDARARAAAAADRLRLDGQAPAARRAARPLVRAAAAAARGAPRLSQVRHRRAAPADGRGVRAPARVHAPGARRVDAGGQSAAPRARPPLRRAAAGRAPGGDRRQLHADHARPAASASRARSASSCARPPRRRAPRLPSGRREPRVRRARRGRVRGCAG